MRPKKIATTFRAKAFITGLIGLLVAVGVAQARPLRPNQAFRFHAAIRHDALVVRWTAAPGYHLYRSRIHLTVSPASVRLAPFSFPKGRLVQDPAFGRQQIYEGRTRLTIPFVSAPAGQNMRVTARYQGCADAGICYPPQHKTVNLIIPPTVHAQPTALVRHTVTQKGHSAPPWATLFVFLIAGLGLAFTPCVFPMIPILSATIVGQRDGSVRPLALSLSYVAGMALTYTAAGILAALTGHYIQAAFQNPWILSAFSLLFAVLALSMFGVYELALPSGLAERFAGYGRGGTLTGTFVLGAFSALIVGPCVAAPLAGALLLISHTGDAVFGGLALLALSIGMGIPLVVVGTSAGHLLPKAGPWLTKTRAIFGVVLLGVAIWLESRILPPPVVLALWSVLAIVSAVAFGALEPLREGGCGGRQGLMKGFGIAVFIYGLLLALGAASGATSPAAPLAALMGARGGSSASPSALHFRPVHTLTGLRAVLKEARGRPVMVDFWASWCVQCQRMEANTFHDRRVTKALASFVLVRADVTKNNAASRDLAAHLKVFGPPTLVFFDGKGRRIRDLPGYEGPGALLATIQALDLQATHARRLSNDAPLPQGTS